jgi:hypothetical protein
MGISIGRRPRTCLVAADISMSRRKDLGEMEVRTGEVGNVGLKMVWFMKPGLPGCYRSSAIYFICNPRVGRLRFTLPAIAIAMQSSFKHTEHEPCVLINSDS